MRFGLPQLLPLVLLAPVVWWAFRAQARWKVRTIAGLGDPRQVEELLRLVDGRRQAARDALLCLALAFAIFALCRPQWGSVSVRVKRRGLDIAIALDTSRSMKAGDISPSRFIRAKREIRTFIDRLKGDRISLIPFSGVAFPKLPLTSDYAAAKLFVESTRIGELPGGGTTNLASAIRVGTRVLLGAGQRGYARVLIIITDGESHSGDHLEAADEAAAKGIVIHTVGVGSRTGEPIPIRSQSGKLHGYHRDGRGRAVMPRLDARSLREATRRGGRRGRVIGYHKDGRGRVVMTRLDERTLREVASRGKGRYFGVGGGGIGMERVFGQIASLQRADLEGRLHVEYKERFQIFLAIGLLLLLGATALGERKRSAT